MNIHSLTRPPEELRWTWETAIAKKIEDESLGSLKEERRKFYRQLGRVSAIGLEMGLCVAIGLAIGYFLDRYFQTKPWLTIIFLILGIVAGFRSLFSLTKELDKTGRKK